MRRRFNWDKRYLYWGVTAFCVIAAALLFYFAVGNITVFGNAVSRLVSILAPFICYFVNKRGWYWISIVLSLFLLGVWSSLMGYLSRIF